MLRVGTNDAEVAGAGMHAAVRRRGGGGILGDAILFTSMYVII